MNVIAATAYWGAFLLWGAVAPAGACFQRYRIRVEEQAPLATAGGACAAYMRRTKRLLPFVF
jgi:protein-S-isoprenylcysteine O-methyltransferase Ste14